MRYLCIKKQKDMINKGELTDKELQNRIRFWNKPVFRVIGKKEVQQRSKRFQMALVAISDLTRKEAVAYLSRNGYQQYEIDHLLEIAPKTFNCHE